jgi:aryl-alcohol dehydrogenase-like predicted oxidoreductase
MNGSPIAWHLHQPHVTAPIASATSVGQVEELLGGVRLKLDGEDLAELDVASKPGP